MHTHGMRSQCEGPDIAKFVAQNTSHSSHRAEMFVDIEFGSRN